MLKLWPMGQAGEPGRTRTKRAAWAMGAIGMVLVVLLGWWLGNVLLRKNLHTVIPGRVYRSGQPTPAFLQRALRDLGIRSVVNLRGCCNPLPWYVAEGQAIQELGINQEDICFSALHMPPAPEIRQLIDVLERTEYPILLHCRQGADRTGVAAVVVMLMQPGVSCAAARRELGLYYGHLPFGRTAFADRFFDLYEDWLRAEGKEHSPEHFRHWALDEYRGGWCNGGIESVEALKPARANRPIAYRVRVRNRSNTAWHFSPHVTAGMHVFFRILDAEGNGIKEDRAGMLEATVPPGESFDVTMVLPALPVGRYWLSVDMIEEGHAWFAQLGAEPWEEEFIVRE